MVNFELKIENKIPTIEECRYLFKSVGWLKVINFSVLESSLQNSIFCIVAKDNEKTIGMGRIIGDGAIYFYIQDIVVHPDYQGKGIGEKIMTVLLKYLEEHAPNQSFVGLFASEGNEKFYEKFEFKDYSPGMLGMFKVISKE